MISGDHSLHSTGFLLEHFMKLGVSFTGLLLLLENDSFSVFGLLKEERTYVTT